MNGDSNSPILRLEKVLDRMFSVNSKNLNTRVDATYRSFWAAVFEIDNPASEYGLLEIISRLNALRAVVGEVKNELSKIPNTDTSLYTKPLDSLMQIANFGVPDNSIPNSAVSVNESNRTAFQFIKSLLLFNTKNNEVLLTTDEVNAILTDLLELKSKITKSDYSDKFKRDLLRTIEMMIKDIRLYDIKGAESFSDALSDSVGALAVHKNFINEHIEDEEIQLLNKIVSDLDSVYSKATATESGRLLSAASSIIPSLTD